MIKLDVTRAKFYNELTQDEKQQYFYQTNKKFIHQIDNIYYSISIKLDYSENPKLIKLFNELTKTKDRASKSHTSIHFHGDLEVDCKTFKIYKYCLSRTDMYDIFILDYLPNRETPRVLVQIRSYGLWTHGYEEMINNSFKNVKELFLKYGCEVDRCMENRIDYCFHTNAIKEPEKVFKDKTLENTLKTNLTKYHMTGRIEKEDGKIKLLKDYFALGERKSNNVFIRFYNKALEVIDMGYKSYFFEIWYKSGIINFYDKFCFEYAMKEKDYNYVHKAKLEFYLIYGKDESKKEDFRKNLNNINLTISDFKKLANTYMPEVTKVLNCELETKRKFYYYSDQCIDNVLKVSEKSNIEDGKLKRLFKIIDNRALFLDYLTSETVKFCKSNEEYTDWWKRLRTLKLDCIKTDLKLIRDYSNKLDAEVMKRRLINTIASNAVYLDKSSNSSFIEDLSDILSNINDNDKYNVNLTYYDDNGEIQDMFCSELLKNYETKKAVKQKRIRNRRVKYNNYNNTDG